MADQALRNEIAELEQWFENTKIDFDNHDEPDRPVFPGNEAEFLALNHDIEDWEKANGQQLDQEEFAAAMIAAHQLGGDVPRALKTLTREWEREEQEWEAAVDEQIKEKLEASLDRKLFPPEREAVLDAIAEGNADNVEAAWTGLYGKRRSDEEIAAVEANHKQQLEEMREQGYSEEHIANHDKETRPKLAERIADMKRAGTGAFDMSSHEGRVEAMASLVKPVEKPEMRMEDIDGSTSQGRVAGIEALLEGRVIDAPEHIAPEEEAE
jgi:hypothetical protein